MIKDTRVKALADDIFAYINKDCSFLDIMNGNFSQGTLPDLSLEKLLKNEAFAKKIRDIIDKLRNAKLDHYDEMMMEIMDYFASSNFSMGLMPPLSKYYYLDFAVTPYSCILPYLDNLRLIKLKDKNDIKTYTNTIMQYPRLVRQIKDKTVEQAKQGIFLPIEEGQLVLNMLKTAAQPLEKHPLHLSDSRVSHIPGDHTVFMENVAQSITTGVQILNELISFLNSEDYKQNQKMTVGLSQYPEGVDYYNFLVKYHLHYDIEPEEINKLGWEQINIIESRMEEIRKSLGYDCTRAEFKEIIKKMPDLYEKTREGIGQRMTDYLERIKPVMNNYFDKMCKTDCEVVQLPIEKEQAMTFGYYSIPSAAQPKGQYLYNSSNHEEKNQISCGALVYHELIPGHHYQINLSLENETLHPLFRTMILTAYTEGWAEYSAALAGEMGMYKSPLDEYGRLAMDLFLTTRLVIDTGMNAFGMTREEAAKLLKENSDWHDDMIFSETNRYANDIPAQALGYKFGSVMMSKIREKAKNALGDKFDFREYHTHVLELGAVPLNILEKHIDWYIEQKLN
ncbi:DUF885 domain-containing protein [Cytobacillus sp. FJAT-53684]|uniref:DUF885 domain-containing protein n=1 Tax=Cytobacillus mangrovibacter TaxID=3299024 RepID=A0ABW6JW85_9BACI